MGFKSSLPYLTKKKLFYPHFWLVPSPRCESDLSPKWIRSHGMVQSQFDLVIWHALNHVVNRHFEIYIPMDQSSFFGLRKWDWGMIWPTFHILQCHGLTVHGLAVPSPTPSLTPVGRWLRGTLLGGGRGARLWNLHAALRGPESDSNLGSIEILW